MRLSRFLENAQEQKRFLWPVVLKPDDGAGSEGVQLITDPSGLELARTLSAEHYRIESFVSGTPVSVSVLCGPEKNQILVPTGQVFDREPLGEYVGAHYPLAPEITLRAIRLAREAVLSLPATKGYVGIDMIISDKGPRFDCLIEVNPRLTMSYLKLREIYDQNLAILMLETATSATESPAEQTAEGADNPSIKNLCIVRAPDP
jgi:predicted ATP-grasp superfamily ATP-dependent carboligase